MQCVPRMYFRHLPSTPMLSPRKIIPFANPPHRMSGHFTPSTANGVLSNSDFMRQRREQFCKMQHLQRKCKFSYQREKRNHWSNISAEIHVSSKDNYSQLYFSHVPVISSLEDSRGQIQPLLPVEHDFWWM